MSVMAGGTRHIGIYCAANHARMTPAVPAKGYECGLISPVVTRVTTLAPHSEQKETN